MLQANLRGKFDQADPDNRTLLQEDSQDTAFKKSIWILLPECPCGCAAMSVIEIAVVSTLVTEKNISPQFLRVILLHPLH